MTSIQQSMHDPLVEIIKAKAIGGWLQLPNKQFDGSTPLQVIEDEILLSTSPF